ncbi:MAG TPA: Holliday junction resolvase RuvX, partial [Candidatus Sulfotelmatobacter sp.]|nr:Holliday junction resolvase RuvX [Candidatus Sulfotelmatobacter sp.]
MIRALGVDAGTSRVGLAASDPSGVVATPVGTVSRRPSAAFWDRLLREVAAREIDRIVVGLPRHLDGSEGEAAAAARALAQEVGRRTGL